MNTAANNSLLEGKNICRDKLIIFDYSGTLSLEMAGFARPVNLLQHLKESGLFALGVNSTAFFWDIVNATWTTGSTTGQGYKKVMQDHMAYLFPETAESVKKKAAEAVSGFVDAYLVYSRIDEHWRPVLESLVRNKSVRIVIATDHYAEATDAIILELARWGLKATRLTGNHPGNIVVVNSADIGVHKTDRRFWEIVKRDLPSAYRRILLIDDFGKNEQAADNYRNSDEIAARQKSIIKILRHVFVADVTVFPFIITDKRRDKLIARVAASIDRFSAV